MMIENVSCPECGTQSVITDHSNKICTQCGLVIEESIQYTTSKTPKNHDITFGPISPTLQIHTYVKILKKNPKIILQMKLIDLKISEILFHYKRIMFQTTDQIPKYAELFNTHCKTIFKKLKSQIKRTCIPSYIIAIAIIKHQLNKKYEDFKHHFEKKHLNIYERLRRFDFTQNNSINITNPQTLKIIESAREKIRLKTRLWLKPKIVALLINAITPTTPKETQTKNHYKYILKKKYGLDIQSLQIPQ